MTARDELLGPAAWWANSENGNVRVWTSAQAEALRLAEEVGFPLEALYTQSQRDAAVAAERERCAQYLRDAAGRLTPEGKRTNQVDRHTAHVLATKGDELAHGCHVRA